MSEQLNLGRVTLRVEDYAPDKLEICMDIGDDLLEYEYVSREHALVLLWWLKRWLEPAHKVGHMAVNDGHSPDELNRPGLTDPSSSTKSDRSTVAGDTGCERTAETADEDREHWPAGARECPECGGKSMEALMDCTVCDGAGFVVAPIS